MMGPLARRWTLGAGLVKLEVSSDGFAVCYFNKVLKIAAFLFRDRYFFSIHHGQGDVKIRAEVLASSYC